MLQHVMTACHIDMDMVESHFKSIGTGCSSGTRIVVLIDRRDPIFVNDGDDILIVERKRLPQHRPANSWMDYSFRAYLELLYRNAERKMTMTLNGKPVAPRTIEDRLWCQRQMKVEISHRTFSKGAKTQLRKKSELDVTLGFSPSDCDLSQCGLFLYFINRQTQTRRLIVSYHRPAASFMGGSSDAGRGVHGTVFGMIGVIELDDSMVSVDNGKQKFTAGSRDGDEDCEGFLTELDKELTRCIEEYYDRDAGEFQKIQKDHEALGDDISVEFRLACWCLYGNKTKNRFWPGWLMNRHDWCDTRDVPREVLEAAGAKDFRSQLVQLFPIKTGGRGHQDYAWVMPDQIKPFTPGAKRPGNGLDEDNPEYEKAVKEAEGWCD
jgi:hypothetical protein